MLRLSMSVNPALALGMTQKLTSKGSAAFFMFAILAGSRIQLSLVRARGGCLPYIGNYVNQRLLQPLQPRNEAIFLLYDHRLKLEDPPEIVLSLTYLDFCWSTNPRRDKFWKAGRALLEHLGGKPYSNGIRYLTCEALCSKQNQITCTKKVTKDILKTKKKAQNVAGVPGSQSTLADSRPINPSSRAQNRNSSDWDADSRTRTHVAPSQRPDSQGGVLKLLLSFSVSTNYLLVLCIRKKGNQISSLECFALGSVRLFIVGKRSWSRNLF
ncbi:hypothetical protein QL285_075804 [Trifolium repens]|nr:hypothetical protein QL285_075804 [Trifolium repens]